jgi:hypothetical protein
MGRCVADLTFELDMKAGLLVYVEGAGDGRLVVGTKLRNAPVSTQTLFVES